MRGARIVLEGHLDLPPTAPNVTLINVRTLVGDIHVIRPDLLDMRVILVEIPCGSCSRFHEVVGVSACCM